MEHENRQEKRSEKRDKCDHNIQFELSGRHSDQYNRKFDGCCIDVSNYGAGILTEYKLEGSEVIKLYLPVKSTNSFMPVFAQVMWTETHNQRTRTGLRFLI